MTTTPRATLSLDFDEVHRMSVDLLTILEGHDVGKAAGALALSLGRVMSLDNNPTSQNEVKFVQSVIEWIGAYQAEGGLN